MPKERIEVRWATSSYSKQLFSVTFAQLGIGTPPDNIPVDPQTIYQVMSLHGGYWAFISPGQQTPPLTMSRVGTDQSDYKNLPIREKYPAEIWESISLTRVIRPYDYPPLYNPFPSQLNNPTFEKWRNGRRCDSLQWSDVENVNDLHDVESGAWESEHTRNASGTWWSTTTTCLMTSVVVYDYVLERARDFGGITTLLAGIALYKVIEEI